MLSEAQKTAIRHLTPPAQDRQMTKQQLADAIGVTVRAIQKWEAGNPEFIAALEKSREQYSSDPEWFNQIMRHHAMEALLKGALMDDTTRDELLHKRACIKELLQQTSHLADARDRVDMSAYTDAELLQLAVTGDLDVRGYTKQDLEEALKGAEA